MKKKLLFVCILGIMAFGVCACGGKNASGNTEDNTGTEIGTESQTGTEGNSNDTVPTIYNSGRVTERADYIGYQDLDIDKYVTLNDYKNMKVTAYKPEVNDESIKNYINANLLTGSITNRAVEEGDVANIDYVGKKDGVAFEGGTASGYDLGIGSGSFIPGFEEGLIGVMPGETVDIPLTFPEDYHAEELAGQEVVFTVTVNSISSTAEYDSVTVEEMESMGLPYKSKEELWEAGKAGAEGAAEETFESGRTTAILDKILEESTISQVPEYLVDEEIQSYEIYMDAMCQMYYGMDFEAFLTAQGITVAGFEADSRSDCEVTVQKYFILEALLRAEGLEVTDNDVKEHAQKEAENYPGYTADTYIEDMGGATAYRMHMIEEALEERLNRYITVEPTSNEQ